MVSGKKWIAFNVKSGPWSIEVYIGERSNWIASESRHEDVGCALIPRGDLRLWGYRFSENDYELAYHEVMVC